MGCSDRKESSLVLPVLLTYSVMVPAHLEDGRGWTPQYQELAVSLQKSPSFSQLLSEEIGKV